MTRQATSMTLDRALLDEARGMGINLSRAAERGIRLAIREEQARRWRAENEGAIDDYNAFVAESVPLAGFRKF
jgi:antitoxin CcdA